MSRNLTTLLEQAALLRSCGASWESVGRKTGRRAGTCRNWPKRYADKWNPLYREASAARYEELGNEAEMTLRHLLRDDDKKWQIKSAEVLLRHRNIPAAITDNTFPNDGQERLTAVEWSRKNHDKEMDAWRAARGLPPYQSHEERLGELKAFYDYLDKEELDYYRKVLEVKEPEPRPQPPLAEAMEVNTPSPTGSSIILPTLLALVGIAIGALLVERQSHVGLESPTYVGLSSPTPSHITLGTTPARLDSNSAARSTLPEPSAMPNTLQTGHSSFLQFTFAAALCGMMLDAPHAAEPAKEGKEKAKANRLAKESSPYLLQHAHNPVDWYPWGPEAFEKAKKDKKLVFLSIGYSSCHWCHVMEKESFSNKDVADYLNANFVCIKVDREERPDIDEIYMTALHTMGTRGGWPLSMFLTADGKPVVGGTYWPREDREIEGEKVNGYKTILKMMVKVWNDKPKEIQTQADEYAEQTAAALERGIRANPILDLDRALANGAAESVREDIDPTFGGIGSRARKFVGTKFPMPTSVMAVLDYAVREKDDDLKKLVKLTLDQMLMGGIYDQLGGGFHRYSTERTWTVPHFEKMLYDNGQLVELYSEAYRQTRDPNYARVIRETLGFIQRELTSPEGGFYSALDADSNGTEGEFYVWTAEEIEKVIGDKNDVALLRAIYGVTGSPNFEKKFYILKLPRPFEEIAKEQKIEVAELTKKLDAIKKKLFDYRAKRERPFLDTKVLTAWNGQMIAGYAKAGEVLKEPEYVKAAIKNAEFLLKNLRNKDGRLMRTWGVTGEGKSAAKLNAYLDDYAFLSHGLLNLYEATGDKKWLDEAKALMDVVVKWHGDGERGGYFFTSSDHEKLFARPKDYFDGAQPSANGVVTRNLVRLWRFTKNDNYRKLAEKSFRQFAGILRSNPSGVPGMCLALHLYLDEKEAKPEKKEPKNETPTATDPLKSEDVVKLAASAGKVESGRQNIEIKLSIAKPWHIYANPSGSDGTVGNQTTVSMRIGGKPVEMMVSYPEGMLVEEKEVGYYRVYEKEVVIKAVLLRKDEGSAPLDVQVKIVACSRGDGGRCLAPSVLKSTIK